jgi:hypothetical protein
MEIGVARKMTARSVNVGVEGHKFKFSPSTSQLKGTDFLELSFRPCNTARFKMVGKR